MEIRRMLILSLFTDLKYLMLRKKKTSALHNGNKRILIQIKKLKYTVFFYKILINCFQIEMRPIGTFF
jgi:hypothetical protein